LGVKWGPLEEGDLRKEKDLQRAFEVRRPWAVMHFAAYAYVGESTSEPAKYYDNNVGGTAKLLQACAGYDLGGDNYLGRSATIILAGRVGRERRL
jgi:UDP-arabinose 4-epimerase